MMNGRNLRFLFGSVEFNGIELDSMRCDAMC